jgi:RNA polymerase sigma-70 factor (ECF subfamily)
MIANLEQTAVGADAFTDEHLMAMIQAHHQGGLNLLHDRYAILLKSMSMKVLHNDADADDLLQDVFVEIWDRAASYDPMMGRPLSWIATLTRRRSIDRLRKRETYCRVEDRFAEETQSRGEGWTHVHEDLSQNERSRHLNAAHTGIPLGTIKTRLELGLQKMAACLFGFEDLLWAESRAACA